MRSFRSDDIGSMKMAGTATIANNVLMEIRRLRRPRLPRQRAAFGIFGRNTASNPIAGNNAQT